MQDSSRLCRCQIRMPRFFVSIPTYRSLTGLRILHRAEKKRNLMDTIEATGLPVVPQPSADVRQNNNTGRHFFACRYQQLQGWGQDHKRQNQKCTRLTGNFMKFFDKGETSPRLTKRHGAMFKYSGYIVSYPTTDDYDNWRHSTSSKFCEPSVHQLLLIHSRWRSSLLVVVFLVRPWPRGTSKDTLLSLVFSNHTRPNWHQQCYTVFDNNHMSCIGNMLHVRFTMFRQTIINFSNNI